MCSTHVCYRYIATDEGLSTSRNVLHEKIKNTSQCQTIILLCKLLTSTTLFLNAMIKMVADYLGSPLTDVINTCIKNLYFPFAWKLTCICVTPKGNQMKSEKDLRPISILPVLSKVYELLIFRQLSDFINKNNVLNSNISAYRKGQSTTTVLQAIRDDLSLPLQSL